MIEESEGKLASSAKIPVWEDERSDESPEVEAKTQPAGAHLDPHSWHAALHHLGGCVWSGGQKRGENEVKLSRTLRLNL